MGERYYKYEAAVISGNNILWNEYTTLRIRVTAGIVVLKKL